MKADFTEFEVFEVVVPVRKDILEVCREGGKVYAGNRTWPDMPIHLVEGRHRDGFTVVGECNRGESPETVRRTLEYLLSHPLPAAAPVSAFRSESDWEVYPKFSWEHPSLPISQPLLESLVLDAVGKRAGLSVSQLHGGAMQDRVATDYWANRPGAETLEKLIAEARSVGCHGIKMKCSAEGETVESVLAIQDAVPDGFHITIDPMNSWPSFGASQKWLEKLSACPFHIQLEDPYPYAAVDDWRRCRQHYPVSLIWHARSTPSFLAGVAADVADGYNFGGDQSWFYYFHKTAYAAQLFQKNCWCGSCLELGVLQHLRLHAAATAPNCVLPSDFQSEWLREHTLVNEPMQYEGGAAVVPTTPGIGVSLDRDAIARYQKANWRLG